MRQKHPKKFASGDDLLQSCGFLAAHLKFVMSNAADIRFSPRTTKEEVEEGLAFAPKFDEHGLIPCMTVDADTGAPLMLAYMNEESLKKTLSIGEAVYWSRSRKKLWHKGETSGEIQEVVEMSTDCDQDAIVLRVKQMGGGCCHTKRATCFYRVVADASDESGVRLVMK
jgi:phosphoribosyl-AMP cyclohydrolase